MDILEIEYTGLDGKAKKLKDIVNPKHIFMIEGVNKPIIMKQGIAAILEEESIKVTDIKISMIGSDARTCLVSAIVTLSCGDKFVGVGYGEAAPQLNLESEISGNYPQALAVKRAVSQGTLNALNIDAYSDIDSPDFDRKRPIRIEDISDALKLEIGAVYAKRILLERIKANLQTTTEELKAMVKEKLGAKSGKIDLAGTSLDTLIELIAALG